MEDYNSVIREDPNSGDAYYNRAYCSSEIGRFEAAIEDYSTAIRLLPSSNLRYSMAFTEQGIIKSNLGRHEEAMKDFSAAIQQSPQLAKPHYNQGNALMGMNRFEEAIASYSVVTN